MSGKTIPFMSPRHFSTATATGIEFARRYVEVVFDNLMIPMPSVLLWCKHARQPFKRSSDVRGRILWGTAGNDGSPPRTSFPPSDLPDDVLDEAVWQVGRYLNKLYLTVPIQEAEKGPIVISDECYHVHLGACSLPGAQAKTILGIRAWESLLSDLTETLYVDMVLWVVQLVQPRTVLTELMKAMGPELNTMTRPRREAGSEPQWQALWEENSQRAIAGMAEKLAAPIASVDLMRIDALTAEFLGRMPPALRLDRIQVVRQYRERVIENTLIVILERDKEPEGALDDLFLRYLRESGRRAAFEQQASAALLEHLKGGTYDVVQPIRGEVPSGELLENLGFVLSSAPPTIEGLRAIPRALYAALNGVRGRNVEDAVQTARRKLKTALALTGIVSGAYRDCETLDALVRVAGLERWGFIGRRANVPNEAVGTLNWAAIAGELQELFSAEDNFAMRIQEAIIHLYRGEAAYDAEDRFDEAWKVLELIGGKASGKGSSLLCYVPFYRVPKTFLEMNTRAKEEFLLREYRRLTRQFKQLTEVRNEGVVHREIPRADWQVLEQHAGPALSLARDAVWIAVSGWRDGARRAEDVVRSLKNAYERRFGIRLPTEQDLRD